jgi:hypothetical protein
MAGVNDKALEERRKNTTEKVEGKRERKNKR